MANDFTLTQTWRPLPEMWRLAATAVHVYAARLDRKHGDQAYLHTLLNTDEQERARRFYFDRDRNHYIAARGLLRILLGRYLQTPPDHVTFAYGPNDKPMLDRAIHDSNLTFNISHSKGVGLLAFGRDREIGVDVEGVRLVDDAEAIAERFFSASENMIFRQVPEAQKGQAFFNCWTRKEAFIKAIGEGLSHPLDTFDVTLRPGEPARLLRIDGSETAASRWQLHNLDPYPGYVGAVIASGQSWSLTCFRWPD